MPVESRTLTSDRLTEEAKEEVIDDESNNAEQHPGASKEAIHQGEAGTELPLLFALRQNLPGRHPGTCLRVGESQPGGPRDRSTELRGDRSGRAAEVASRPAGRVVQRNVPAPTGATGDDPEGQWRRTATGDPDHTGSGGADRSQIVVGADLRSGFGAERLRI